MVCINNKQTKSRRARLSSGSCRKQEKVLVRADTTFVVGDHDFTKVSIIPSVSLVVDIPDKIYESWYGDQVAKMQCLNPQDMLQSFHKS